MDGSHRAEIVEVEIKIFTINLLHFFAFESCKWTIKVHF